LPWKYVYRWLQESGDLHQLSGRVAEHFDLQTVAQRDQLAEQILDIPQVGQYSIRALIRLAQHTARFVVIEEPVVLSGPRLPVRDFERLCNELLELCKVLGRNVWECRSGL
jgi:hypothetical protein